SPESRSLTVICKISHRGSISETSGSPLPHSHLDTVLSLMASRSASCRWVRFRVRRISAMKRPVLLWSMGISLLSDGIIASGRPEEHPRTVEWRPRGAKTPPAKRGGAAGGKRPCVYYPQGGGAIACFRLQNGFLCGTYTKRIK